MITLRRTNRAHSSMGTLKILMAGVALSTLAACGDKPLDFDLRGLGGGFSTADAATKATAKRPKADNRGVISYPDYQVVVAKRGETVNQVAARLGLDANALARHNGIAADVPLRTGEVIALPQRVAEPSIETGFKPSEVDVTGLAGAAIDSAPDTTQAAVAPRTQTGVAPTRHRVERGETAFTIARLYQVPVRALADWNGLGADFAIREGQHLLIPTAKATPPRRGVAAVETVPLPGAGSVTPTPPSAVKPLPQDDTTPRAQAAAQAAATPAVANVGKETKARSAKLVTPVQGDIIREYAKGKNEGINIKGAAGASVKAADAGTVAAITKSAKGVPIIVIRHTGNLLTVYANVTDVKVQKGDAVRRGQSIANLRSGADAFVHFEVRKGFDSVDPVPYLQ